MTTKSSDTLQTSHPGVIPEPDHLMALSCARLCCWDVPIGQPTGPSPPSTPSPGEITIVCSVTGLETPILLSGCLGLLVTCVVFFQVTPYVTLHPAS